MRRAAAVVGSAAALLLLAVVGTRLLDAGSEPENTGSRLVACVPTDGRALPVLDGFDAEQVGNGAWIAATGAELGISERGQVIAVATALQESSLRVLEHGDQAGPDSRGLFQQRDSWGPLEVRLDPKGSAQLFYEQLVQVPGWDTRPLTEVAQDVQFSAHPTAYAKHEPDAIAMVAAVAGVACTYPPPASPGTANDTP